jgi:hypothetical protein
VFLFVLQKSNQKYGNEHEAIAVYHMMQGVQKFCPIYTLCVGNAFGEAALLLSAGSKVRGKVTSAGHLAAMGGILRSRLCLANDRAGSSGTQGFWGCALQQWQDA